MKVNQNGGSNMNPVAIVLAVFLFIILCIYLYSSYKKIKDKKKSWPPNGIGACPDYWVNYGKGVCVNPFEVGNMDSCRGIKSITDPKDPTKKKFVKDFSSKQYTDSNGNYNKCVWAKSCDTPWEGIDNMCA